MRISDYPYKEELIRTQDWIKSADQKISIAFAVINGVALAFIIPASKVIISNVEYLQNYLFTVSLLEILAFLAISELCALRALFPDVTSNGNSRSLLFFGTLSKIKHTELKSVITSTSASDLQDDYLNQLIVSSKIASAKHRQLQNAIQALSVSLIFMVVMLGATIFLQTL